MTAVKGTIKGAKALEKRLKRLGIKTEADIVEAVRTSVLAIHARAVRLIQDNGSGTKVIRYGPKRTRIASRPGQPPNTDTGRLAQSIKFDFEDNGLTGMVGTNVKYGRYLEFGTDKMEARPWLSTAVRAERKNIPKVFREEFTKSLKKAGNQ